MVRIEGYHGTNAEFDVLGARPDIRGAEYWRGSPLEGVSGVWISTNPDNAASYAYDDEKGRLLHIVADADRVARVDSNDYEGVGQALAGNPEVLILEDQEEILILDPGVITHSKPASISWDEVYDLYPDRQYPNKAIEDAVKRGTPNSDSMESVREVVSDYKDAHVRVRGEPEYKTVVDERRSFLPPTPKHIQRGGRGRRNLK